MCTQVSRKYFLKLKEIYDMIGNIYANLLLNNTFSLIVVYFITTILLNLGLFQLNINPETESLSYIRNSPALENSKLLTKTYVFDQHKRHFSNQLLDFGHYVEIIVCKRELNADRRSSNDDLLKPEFNMINRTLLDEFNHLYDSILDLEIEDDFDDDSSSNVTGRPHKKYQPDLCAKRLEKCAIEGGLARTDSFQQAFLKNAVDFNVKDPKLSYADVSQLDGINIDIFFGKYRIEKKIENSDSEFFGPKHAIVQAGSLRIRFDLLATTEREQYMAKKFMKRFVEHMTQIQEEDRLYKNLNISFYASHTFTDEIEKYSKIDLKFIILTLVVLFGLFCLSMWFYLFNFDFKWLCLQSASYLPIIAIIQFILISTSTFGTCSLLNIQTNQLCFSIVLIVLSKFYYIIFLNFRFFRCY